MSKAVLRGYIKSGVALRCVVDLGVVEGSVAGHGACGDHEAIGAACGAPLHVVDGTLLALTGEETDRRVDRQARRWFKSNVGMDPVKC